MCESDFGMREKEKFSIRVVKMNSLWGLLGIRGIDRIPNDSARKKCLAKKGMDERIDVSALLCSGRTERMENIRTAKWV